MKIGIITLPFDSNFGGIIQCYALQEIIKKLGHDVYIIKHSKLSPPRRLDFPIRYLIYFKRFLDKYICHKNIDVFVDLKARERFPKKLQNNNIFIKTHMTIWDIRDHTSDELNFFDCFIVGSDQVWRPIYAIPIEKYYLKFAEDKAHIRRIAYAASFGTDKWEYSEKQTAECARLAQKFDLITVREDSGIKLCQDNFGVKAVHVLDPTMLLNKEDYIALIAQEKIPKSSGNLFAYMLDNNELKQSYVEKVASKLALNPFTIIPTDKELDEGKAFPGVTTWLRSFMDADFIVTDSFHGCVFSIIFNKPFIAVGNMGRGQDRFDSLFRLFQLQDRLVDISNLSISNLPDPIDWTKVNSIWQKMKKQSIALLSNSLT